MRELSTLTRKGVFSLDEAEAVRRLQSGDRTAFDHLYGAYAAPAIRTAYLITRHQTAAEDAVQEAFVQVLRNISRLRAVTSFRPWFYQIVVNAARRLVRSGGHQLVPLDLANHDKADLTSPAPDEVALTAEEAERLRTAIAQLNEAYRVPVILRYFTGLSEQEVAHALGLPQGTVKSRLHTARRRLLASLESDTEPAVFTVPRHPAHSSPWNKE